MEPNDEALLQIGGHSSHMRAVMEMAARVALVDTTVLLTGESGVGKEYLTQFIHERSSRRTAKLVAVNCAALTGTLLESELFGHRRGSFTGAIADRAGLIEAADHGTLFLDEIGEMPLEMQASLLRVLQVREVRRIGDNIPRPVNVRIIAATNRDLAAEVREHRFRSDLFYRLNVFHLDIPPLRERPDDLRTLAESILRHTAERLQRRITGFAPDAAEVLLTHDWPGNIRELQNAIEHACVMATGESLDVQDLPATVRGEAWASVTQHEPRSLRDIEREYIFSVMRKAGGNRRAAAKVLKIGLATLQRKLRRYKRERHASTSLDQKQQLLRDD
jgi:two-component system response regulator HydG